MNNVTTPQIICGKCGRKHLSVFEVKRCYDLVVTKECFATMPHTAHQSGPNWCPGLKREPAAVEQKPLTRGVTGPQLDYIAKLGGDPVHAAKLTMREASLYIDNLKRAGKAVTEPILDPVQPKLKVPLEMLHAVPDGYYATQPDANTPHTFFRIIRPKSGKFKNTLKVQTQHGPDLKLAYVIYPGDKVYVYNRSSQVEQDLLLVVVDPHGSAIEYADKIGRCMRCNLELTDERSRWYGIGPECEKHWPWVIAEQNDRKGEYRYGISGTA